MLKGITCQVCNNSMTTETDSGLKITKSRYAIINDDGTRTLACEKCFKKHHKKTHEVIQVPIHKNGKNFKEWKKIPIINLDGDIKEREDEDGKV